LHLKPEIKGDETDNDPAYSGERGAARKNSFERCIACLTPDLVFGPADLPIYVGKHRA
jgi:hypothetical protein